MKKGFTLIETMVVMLIVVFVFAALFRVMSTGRTAWSSADTQIALQQDLRRAAEEIIIDLRKSSSTQVSCPADGSVCTSIVFNVSQGTLGTDVINWTNSSGSINYSLSGNQINRSQGGSWRIVANNITTLGFVRQAATPRILTVTMTARRNNQFSRTLNASLNASALLRN